MKKMICKNFVCLIIMLAGFAIFSSILAQPTMSRGEQRLSISYDECMSRAENAFTNEGWVNIGKGGAFVNAFKDNHGAYIMCNVAPENKIWVNIVVASLSQDDNVPGAERVKLQKWMDKSVGLVSEKTCWKWSVEMKNGSQSQSVLTMFPNGKVTISWGLSGTWRSEGARYWFDWGRGAGKEDNMILSGNTLSGDNFETNWIKGEKIPC